MYPPCVKQDILLLYDTINAKQISAKERKTINTSKKKLKQVDDKENKKSKNNESYSDVRN